MTTARTPLEQQTRSATTVLWILIACTAAAVALLLRLRPQLDVDIWLHLRIGEALRSGVRFQTVPDPLVVLADRPYVPTQWLAEVVGSVAYDAAGIVGIHVLRYLALVALVVLVQATGRIWTSPARSMAITLGVVVATATAWGERPQLLGLVFGAATVWLWTRTWRDGRPRWLLVPLAWVWSMCHGSWALGLAVGALFVLATVLQHRPFRVARLSVLGVLVASTVVVGLTPLGPGLLLEPLKVGTLARATVNEWQAPSPGNPLFLLVVVLGVVVLVRSVRRLPEHLPAALVALAGVGLAATSVRTVAFGALLVGAALSRSLAVPADPEGSRWPELVPGVVAAVLLAAVPGVVYGGPAAGPLSAAVDAGLGALPTGTRVASDVYAWNWMVWAHPDLAAMRDLRAEIYSPEVAEPFEDFMRAAPGWQAYADAEDVGAVAVRDDSPLGKALAGETTWRAEVSADGWTLWRRG